MIKKLVIYSILLQSVFIGAADASNFRTVALSDIVVPGLAGASFGDLGVPTINKAGQTAFLTRLSGLGVSASNDDSLWSESGGSLSMVARTGAPAPGSGDALFNSFQGSPVLNVAGQVAFRATLTGTGVNDLNDQGVWSQGNGSLALIARAGDAAPGTLGAVFTKPQYNFPPGGPFLIDAFADPVINDIGETAFYANLPSYAPNAYSNGVWLKKGGPLELITARSYVAPGMTDAVFTGLGSMPVLNSSGVLQFGGVIGGVGVIEANNNGTWRAQNGTITIGVREGDSAPGLTNVQFGPISQPTLNSAGQISFYSSLVGAGVGPSNDEAIWSNASGSLTLVARESEIAPGTAGARFTLESSQVKINAAGETLFHSGLSGLGITEPGNHFGMWASKDGVIRLIVRAGDVAPDTGGAMFYFPSTQGAVLNGRGQVAFISSLIGTGVTTDNRFGIWGSDLDGTMRLIVRTSDTLEVSPGDFRTIANLAFGNIIGTGNEDGRPGGFNDRGQLAFHANFTDGTSGIFVSNMLVPEPTSCGPFVFIALLFGRRRPRSSTSYAI